MQHIYWTIGAQAMLTTKPNLHFNKGGRKKKLMPVPEIQKVDTLKQRSFDTCKLRKPVS